MGLNFQNNNIYHIENDQYDQNELQDHYDSNNLGIVLYVLFFH